MICDSTKSDGAFLTETTASTAAWDRDRSIEDRLLSNPFLDRNEKYQSLKETLRVFSEDLSRANGKLENVTTKLALVSSLKKFMIEIVRQGTREE